METLDTKKKKKNNDKFLLLIFVACIALFLVTLASLRFGAASLTFGELRNALFHYQPDQAQQQIIRELRLPRVIGAILVGAALAVSGALMQGLTGNRLADSSLLGINSGAALGLTIALVFFQRIPYIGTLLFSIGGAAVSTLLVLWLSSSRTGNSSPLRLILGGSAINLFFSALSEGLSLYKNIGRELSFWMIGGTANISWKQLQLTVPLLLFGLLLSFVVAKSITLLSLGEEVAIGLGQRIGLIRFFTVLSVLLLSGCAVAMVGPIAFVGLIIPTIVRFFIGQDYQKIVLLSSLLGGLLVVGADLISRLYNPPLETPFGLFISLLGVPFFLYLIRSGGIRN